MTNNKLNMDDYNWGPFAELMANLIAKYIDKLNLDDLPDPVMPPLESDFSSGEDSQAKSNM